MIHIQKRAFCFLVALTLIFTGVAIGVYAILQKEIALTGTLRTGKVEIDLIQPKITEHVLPGQEIKYEAAITAKGADCYVRLIVDIYNQKDTTDPITIQDIKPAAGWVWKGNALYSCQPLKTGKTVTAIEEIVIPSQWTEDTASDFQISLIADAIQKEHFVPNFASDSPWGTVEIEEHKEDSHPEYRTAHAANPKAITYVGNGLFEVPSGDLFANFPELLPGDEASDSITIRNGTSQPITLSFSSIPEKEELLDEIGMKLSVDGKTFYNGTLDGKGLEAERVLTTLEAGERTELEYAVQLPADFENAFSMEADFLTWKVEAKESEQAVQTGDEFPLSTLSAMIICICSGAFLLVFNAKRKEE